MVNQLEQYGLFEKGKAENELVRGMFVLWRLGLISPFPGFHGMWKAGQRVLGWLNGCIHVVELQTFIG